MSGWLIDASALVRVEVSPDGDTWSDRVERGLVRIASVTLLEVGYSARSGDDQRTVRLTSPLADMPVEYLTPATEDRAIEVQALLADRGQHRGPAVPDLLVAAAAERAGLTVLHVDSDFETIASVTRQPVERLRL
ncbi:MAG: PIN domain nuclease [Acidimicrobiia bacterium]